MLNRTYIFVKSLGRNRNTWLLGVATALLVAAFNVIGLPEYIARQLGYSGSQRMFAIDLQFNYSPSWVYTVLENYGEKGRGAYGYLLGLLDFIFPLIYTLFLATALTAVLSRLLAAGSGWQKLSLIGLLPGMMDWLENLGILTLIINYPQQLLWLVNLTNIFTMVKSVLVVLSVLMLIGGGVVIFVRRRNSSAKTVKPSKIVK